MPLIGWWKLDGDALDSSSSKNHGTNTGVTFASADGIIGEGGVFVGGGSSKIDISSVTLTTHHSLAFWMYGEVSAPGGATGNMVLGTSEVNTDWIYTADSLRIRINDGTSRTWEGDGLDVDYYQKWKHVVVLFETSTMELYIDGISQPAPDNPQPYSGTFTMDNIGTPYNGDTADFIGNLNDVRIYDHILSLKELQELAKAKVIHYQFSQERDTVGDIISDSSGYGRHATLDANKPTWSGITSRGVGCYDWAAAASNDYIQINTTDFPVVLGDAFSVSYWVYHHTIPTWSTHVHGNITTSWSNGFWLAPVNINSMRFAIGSNSKNFNPGLALETWFHIFATYNGVNANVFINGVSKAGNPAAVHGAITNNNGIGLGRDGSGSYDLHGKIADFRIYNKGYDFTDGQAESLFLYHTSAQLDDKGNFWC